MVTQENKKLYTHPDFAKDEYIKEELSKVVDYIRDNYDLDTFTRI